MTKHLDKICIDCLNNNRDLNISDTFKVSVEFGKCDLCHKSYIIIPYGRFFNDQKNLKPAPKLEEVIKEQIEKHNKDHSDKKHDHKNAHKPKQQKDEEPEIEQEPESKSESESEIKQEPEVKRETKPEEFEKVKETKPKASKNGK